MPNLTVDPAIASYLVRHPEKLGISDWNVWLDSISLSEILFAIPPLLMLVATRPFGGQT